MTGCARLAVLLLALPASATISYVRSATTWSGGTSSCTVALTTTNAPDLAVVWGEWQTSGPNTITATATHSQSGSGRVILSAVGPTVQQSATNPTAAQIFYVANLTTGGETATLTFSATVASSACVIVEYSGADTNYPLDSASAAFSYSASGFLDSGNVAPANSNLMVFAAGFADQNTPMLQGSGFTSLQASHGTWGTAMVESSTTAISGNNTLQRATACIGSMMTCPPGTTTGDWLIQMAIFRDASWTVQGGWGPARPGALVYADQFPNVQAAINALPSTGGTVLIQPSASEYACPTSIPSNTALVGLGSFADYNFIGSLGFGNVTTTQVVIGPCNSAISIANGAQNIRLQNLTLDFNDSGKGLTFVNGGGIQMYGVNIVKAGGTGVPALELQANVANSFQNKFEHVQINCNQGTACQAAILLEGGSSSGGTVTNNYFEDISITGLLQCGVELEYQTDTNFWVGGNVNPDGPTSENAAFCFNLLSPNSDQDANANAFMGWSATGLGGKLTYAVLAGQSSGHIFIGGFLGNPSTYFHAKGTGTPVVPTFLNTTLGANGLIRFNFDILNMVNGVPITGLDSSPALGEEEFCTNCVPTTPSTCSAATPASCICHAADGAGGRPSSGSMFAKYENYLNANSGTPTWYCH